MKELGQLSFILGILCNRQLFQTMIHYNTNIRTEVLNNSRTINK